MELTRARARQVALVAGGGFAGAASRHLVAVALPGGFPWGTLAVNVLGSLLLGVLSGRVATRIPADVRLAATTGFLSSFTTYSAFAVETAALPPVLGVANVTANYALGFAAAFVGLSLGAIDA